MKRFLIIPLITAATIPAHAAVFITEVNSNGVGGDFFEIHNTGPTSVSLDGWKWTDSDLRAWSTAFTLDNATIAAGGVAVILAGCRQRNFDGCGCVQNHMDRTSRRSDPHVDRRWGGIGLGRRSCAFQRYPDSPRLISCIALEPATSQTSILHSPPCPHLSGPARHSPMQMAMRA